MARNGSGTYNRAVAPYVAGTAITAATVNQEMDDIATALTGSMARDGQAPPTANIPMGNFRITGLGNAIANTDAAAFGQVLPKAGDTMTGALGVVAGTVSAPGVFVSGDTNTGLFQPAADTLAVTVGGAEVARFGTGGFMRLADGTAAAPAYSFSGDTDTGIYSAGAGIIGFAHNGLKSFEFARNNFLMDISPGTTSGQFYFRAGDASATNARIGIFATLNENSIAVADIRHNVATDGNGNIDFYATPAGDRTLDRRVLRATIPGSGAITMVGPVDVTSGNLNVTTGQLQVGGNPVTIQRDTEKTATGTNVDFTPIPAGVRRVIALLSGVSTNGSSNLLLQLGASGSVEVTGYAGSARAEGLGSSSLTTGVPVFVGVQAAQTYSGRITCELIASNIWIITGLVGSATGQTVSYCGYTKTLAAVLDRLRITTVNGTDTFDAGTINIMWEF